MSWDDIVGKLLARGLSREHIGNMTLRNVHQTLNAMQEERKWDAALQGVDLDDSKEYELNDENASILESAINGWFAANG